MNRISEFVEKRPKCYASFGYGSGIFKQSGYTSKDKPQLDLIIVVDNLKKWHLENMKINKKDYSFIGKLFFKYAKISKLKGNTGITYVSNIKENGNIYKYGTIEKKDLLEYLENWNSFYLPGRFQKIVYPINSNEELDKKIEENRRNALLLAAFLNNKEETTKKDIFVTLCGLSYLGDTRMKFAENPRKVLNIVEGSYDEFIKIYEFDNKYFNLDNDKVIVDFDNIKKDLKLLPSGLINYLGKDINKEDDIIRKKILSYFTQLNKKESSKQTIKGIYTNGICRSLIYASKKVMKKLKK